MSSQPLRLRRLRLADLPAIEAVERRSYVTPWSAAMFTSELSKPTSRCVGAFDGPRLAAYVIVSQYVDAWHVMNVAVDEPYRRRGIARTLLESLMDEAEGDGSRGFTLEVRVSNHEAIRLYERLGFEASGIRRGYYTDNREDALIMWREAEPRPA